jgi:uncharacterized protein (DUF302 family)
MLQIQSAQPLAAIEPALLQAAQRRGVNVLSVIHLGQLLKGRQSGAGGDAIVFTVCRPELSAALLAADIRFAGFVPCRIAALERGGAVTLEALTPEEFCGLLGRPDLLELAAPLGAVLAGILEETASAAHGGPGRAVSAAAGPGATEGMVSARGPLPQRIDCKGTKIEELAGTGQHDASGG